MAAPAVPVGGGAWAAAAMAEGGGALAAPSLDLLATGSEGTHASLLLLRPSNTAAATLDRRVTRGPPQRRLRPGLSSATTLGRRRTHLHIR